MALTLYPLNLPGQRYGSPMPFSLYDPGDDLVLQDFKPAGIYGVGLLAGLEECRPAARLTPAHMYGGGSS